MTLPRIAAVLALASMTLGCTTALDGNGRPGSETRAHDGFAAVESAGPFEVRVQRGDAFSVRVDVDENILALVQTRVEGTTLVVDSHRAIGNLLPGPHVTIVMPHLESASLSGSGLLAISSIAESEPVALSESGSGDLDFQGAVRALSVQLSGSGDVTLAGSAETIALALDGSGSIDARGMPAAEGSVELDGSGDVIASINGPVDVALGGSGDVKLFGQVTIAHSASSGSGRVDVHR